MLRIPIDTSHFEKGKNYRLVWDRVIEKNFHINPSGADATWEERPNSFYAELRPKDINYRSCLHYLMCPYYLFIFFARDKNLKDDRNFDHIILYNE